MENQEHRCKQCRVIFSIEQQDLAFYAKMEVPSPTFCPDCRMQRRMAFRNERSLYPRTCALCKASVISSYSKYVKFPVYCQACWWSDAWDVSQYKKGFDPAKSFFDQFKELSMLVPRPHSMNFVGSRMQNSLYTNCAGDLKNCHLVFAALGNSDCMYSHYINDSRDCVDTLYCIKSENCYECFDIESCFNMRYSQSSTQCRDSYFLFDCKNCSDCIGCSGLRNKQYHIFNKPYSREEYGKKKKELCLNSHAGITRVKKQFLNTAYLSSPRKYYHGQMNNNFSGDYISHAEKSHNAFYTKNARNVKHAFWCVNAQDVYDYVAWGDVEFLYECVSMGDKSYGCKFTDSSWSNDRNLEYSTFCFSSAYLFGCVGLRNKKYCILNTQYSETEFYALRKKIINQMSILPYKDKQGITYTYGEFFPIEISLFPYNDSIAQEHYPITQKESEKRGFGWQIKEKHDTKGALQTKDLPGTIGEVDKSILKKTIACEDKENCNHQCTGIFSLTPQELTFYQKADIPLPRLCFNCRHFERVALRNPLKLWQRDCQCKGEVSESKTYANTAAHFHGKNPCSNSFTTSYEKKRKDVVYCERCYIAEIN